MCKHCTHICMHNQILNVSKHSVWHIIWVHERSNALVMSVVDFYCDTRNHNLRWHSAQRELLYFCVIFRENQWLEHFVGLRFLCWLIFKCSNFPIFVRSLLLMLIFSICRKGYEHALPYAHLQTSAPLGNIHKIRSVCLLCVGVGFSRPKAVIWTWFIPNTEQQTVEWKIDDGWGLILV